jgi:GntR family transcriptional regulator/GntR family frlABCD operon transcriptional regulator
MAVVPQYRKLYEILRKHISDNIYLEGSLLPSENELCRIHGVTRPTVRQALSKLVNEGYIQKHQGRGSIVKPIPKGIGILSIEGTTSSIGANKLITRILTKPEIQPWPEPFFYELSNLEKESGCIYLERLRIVDDVPIMYDLNYLPNINLPRFTSKQFENKSLFNKLRQTYGIEVTGGEQKIWAFRAEGKIAQYLQVAEGDPVVHMQRRLMTNRPPFRFYSSLYCATERYFLFGSF